MVVTLKRVLGGLEEDVVIQDERGGVARTIRTTRGEPFAVSDAEAKQLADERFEKASTVTTGKTKMPESD